MKKFLKVIVGILVIIVVLGVVFFIINYNRTKNQENKENNINDKGISIDIQESGLSSAAPAKKYTLNQEEMNVIFNIIDNLTFTNETCDGLATYFIRYNSEEKENFMSYGIEVFNGEDHITSEGKGEAILSSEQAEKLNEIIKKLD